MAAAKRFILFVCVAVIGAAAAAQPGAELLPLGAPTRSTPAEAIGGPGSITTTIASLMAVVGLIVLLGAIYKWLASRTGGLAGQLGAGGKSPSGLVSVLARYPLGRGQSLVLLKLDRRVLVLCQSASGRVRGGAATHTLSEITDPDEVASIIAKSEGAGGFNDVLHGYEAMESSPDEMRGVEVVDLTRRRGGFIGSLLGRGTA